MGKIVSLLVATGLLSILPAGSAVAQESAGDMHDRIQRAAARHHDTERTGELKASAKAEKTADADATKIAAILRTGKQESAKADAAWMLRIKDMEAHGQIAKGASRQAGKASRDVTWPSVAFEVGSVGALIRWGEGWIDLRVFDVIDESNMLVDVKTGGTTLWLQGFSTENLTDGMVLTYSGPVIVSGTKRYNSLAGSRTVLVVKPFIVDPEVMEEAQKLLNPHSRAGAKAKPAPVKAAAEAAKLRTWTDASGEHKIEAKFGGLIGGQVKLVKGDGSTIKIPLEKLSDEDQAWVKNRKR